VQFLFQHLLLGHQRRDFRLDAGIGIDLQLQLQELNLVLQFRRRCGLLGDAAGQGGIARTLAFENEQFADQQRDENQCGRQQQFLAPGHGRVATFKLLPLLPQGLHGRLSPPGTWSVRRTNSV
jgi:hypothetical protein